MHYKYSFHGYPDKRHKLESVLIVVIHLHNRSILVITLNVDTYPN